MSDDFFSDLGKSFSKVTQSAVDLTSSFIESTKINAQIGGVNKEIEKLYQRIGEAVCLRFADDDSSLGEEILSMMEDVRAHRGTILSLRENLAAVQGRKVCPVCTEIIAADVAFCPKCGAPTPVKEEDDLFQDEETDEVPETLTEDVPQAEEPEECAGEEEAAEEAAEKSDTPAEEASGCEAGENAGPEA